MMPARKRSTASSNIDISEHSSMETVTCTAEFGRLSRRKHIDMRALQDTALARCLSTVDLIFLGIGSTLGAGVYVLTGQVARQVAGPAVNVSFLIAAVASILAGLCYAEFGGRVPKTGSAYVYSYYAIGEIWAFVIGWNLILEYLIATASVARALSGYFDTLIENRIQTFFRDNLPMHLTGLAEYPDFFAFALCLVLTCLLAVGVRESSRFNNVFTVINLLVVVYVVSCGLFKADLHNWQIPESELPDPSPGVDNGSGGFTPFGFSGVMSGAATCFYAFVGFDVIASTGEEVKNPQKAIPVSIIVSLLSIFTAYFLMSTVLTLMCPFYLIDVQAPFPVAFERVGWGVAQYAIAVGAICGLCTSLLGSMFPLPRVLYAMAGDGLIFSFLGKVHPTLRTPVIGTFISGLFAATLSAIFDLKELVDMLSIGTLLAYTLVAVCVQLLRYRPAHPAERDPALPPPPEFIEGEEKSFLAHVIRPAPAANPKSLKAVKLLTLIVTLCAILTSATLIYVPGLLYKLFCLLPLSVMAAAFVLLVRQPQDTSFRSFKMPLVPLLPLLSTLINVYLMLELSYLTWIRFVVWQSIGFLIYFSYGMWHSSERHRDQSATSDTTAASTDTSSASKTADQSSGV